MNLINPLSLKSEREKFLTHSSERFYSIKNSKINRIFTELLATFFNLA